MKTQLPIEYAHCTKAVPGQLDRYPFYQYEKRLANVALVAHQEIGEPCEFGVEIDGRTIGSGDSVKQAIADASYTLMNESRMQAELKTLLAQRLNSPPLSESEGVNGQLTKS